MSLWNILWIGCNLRSRHFVAADSMNEPRFDIGAKIPKGATRDEFYQMFQDMLASLRPELPPRPKGGPRIRARRREEQSQVRGVRPQAAEGRCCLRGTAASDRHAPVSWPVRFPGDASWHLGHPDHAQPPAWPAA